MVSPGHFTRNTGQRYKSIVRHPFFLHHARESEHPEPAPGLAKGKRGAVTLALRFRGATSERESFIWLVKIRREHYREPGLERHPENRQNSYEAETIAYWPQVGQSGSLAIRIE